jgi:hypothetical protein
MQQAHSAIQDKYAAQQARAGQAGVDIKLLNSANYSAVYKTIGNRISAKGERAATDRDPQVMPLTL